MSRVISILLLGFLCPPAFGQTFEIELPAPSKEINSLPDSPNDRTKFGLKNRTGEQNRKIAPLPGPESNSLENTIEKRICDLELKVFSATKDGEPVDERLQILERSLLGIVPNKGSLESRVLSLEKFCKSEINEAGNPKRKTLDGRERRRIKRLERQAAKQAARKDYAAAHESMTEILSIDSENLKAVYLSNLYALSAIKAKECSLKRSEKYFELQCLRASTLRLIESSIRAGSTTLAQSAEKLIRDIDECLAKTNSGESLQPGSQSEF